MAIRPHLNPTKGSQDFFWYGTVNLKCVFALGSDSVRNTAQFSIYGLFFYFENIISVVSLLEWEVGFDCFFVMLILWSQPNLDITWIMIPSYASSLSTVKIGHHRITKPNQCNKIFLFGVYAWEGKNSADQLRILCLLKQDICSMWHAWAATSLETFGITKAAKYQWLWEKSMIVLCNNFINEEEKMWWLCSNVNLFSLQNDNMWV